MPTVGGGDFSIVIPDLPRIRKALKNAEDRSTKEITEAFRPIADKVASDARSRAGATYLSSRAAATLRSSPTTTGAGVKIGSNAVPWALGNEFGGGAHGPGHPTSRGGHTTQFKPWRGRSADAGYALWPAIRDDAPWVEDQLFKAIDHLLEGF